MVALMLALGLRPALACEYVPNERFDLEVRPDAGDAEAPWAPLLVDLHVTDPPPQALPAGCATVRGASAWWRVLVGPFGRPARDAARRRAR